MSEKFLEIKDVTKIFRIGGLIGSTKLAAVDQVNLSLEMGKPQILSLVGESGSGKTTLARMVMRLTQPTEGEIIIDGMSTSGRLSRSQMQTFRRRVQPIFQNPFESFSSRKTADTYLFETARNIYGAKNSKEAHEAVDEALTNVGLSAERVIGRYPNQFSGGELQRVSVARAMIPQPELLVADEPVSMIDASLRMNVVNLFKKLRDEFEVNILYITHDLSTAYYVSDLIAIMYRGNVVEYGPSSRILKIPPTLTPNCCSIRWPRSAKSGTRWCACPTWNTGSTATPAASLQDAAPTSQDICRQAKPPKVKTDDGREVLCFKLVDFEDLTSEGEA